MQNKKVNTRVKLAEPFKTAIRSYPQPLYQIANNAKLCPSVLYRGLGNYDLYKPDDPRFLRVAEAIGYQGQIYEAVLFDESERLAASK